MKLKLKNRELAKYIEDTKFQTKLYLIIPPAARSKRWRLSRLILRYIHALPFTNDEVFDDIWFDFILRDMRKAHHMKKRQLTKFYHRSFNQYFNMLEKISKATYNPKHYTTLGNFFIHEGKYGDLSTFGPILEKVRANAYNRNPEFRKRVDDQHYTIFNKEYWEDLRNIAANIMRYIDNKQINIKKEQGNADVRKEETDAR